MRILSLAQDILYMYNNILYSNIGTYNNMKNQTGYCKMTGFNTVSRNTSFGPPLFTSGRVQFGVGLSHFQFGSLNNPSVDNKPEGSLTCGMCINITSISNFPLFNNELTNYTNINTSTSHIVMVFDQCNDLICTSGFLDIDVYADNIFFKSNTYNISWSAIDCPIYEDEKIEYLLCTVDTCNAQDTKYLNSSNFGDLFSPYYFSITLRNMKRPINSVAILIDNNYKELPYISGSGYTYNGYFQEEILQIEIVDILQYVSYDTFNMKDIKSMKPLDAYHGCILL